MSEALVCYAYTSRYRGLEPEADLASITAAASRNNPTLGVTGVLLYDAGRFIQVVEGPPEGIWTLQRRLLADTRHSDLVELFEVECPTRTFDEWQMRAYRVETLAPMSGPEVVALRDAYVGVFRPSARDFLTLVQTYLKSRPTSP